MAHSTSHDNNGNENNNANKNSNQSAKSDSITNRTNTFAKDFDEDDDLLNDNAPDPTYEETPADQTQDSIDGNSKSSTAKAVGEAIDKRPKRTGTSKLSTEEYIEGLYSESPIYTTQLVSSRFPKWDYNMVRYYVRKCSEFMPDAINIEQGRTKMSSRDIEVLDKIYRYKYTENLNLVQIRDALSRDYNIPLEDEDVSLLNSEEFATMFSSTEFKEFLTSDRKATIDLYNEEIASRETATFEALQQILNIVRNNHNSSTDNQLLLESHAQIKELEDSLIKKDRELDQLKTSIDNQANEIADLKSKLEQEHNKSFFQRLFNK